MRVLVYGTLKRGGGLNSALSGAAFLGAVQTDPVYTMINLGWFPGVLKGGSTAIHGEVFSITEEELAALDRIEGYPNLYTREEVPTEFGDAWMYIYNSHRMEQVQHQVITTGIFPV